MGCGEGEGWGAGGAVEARGGADGFSDADHFLWDTFRVSGIMSALSAFSAFCKEKVLFSSFYFIYILSQLQSSAVQPHDLTI